MKKLFCIIVLLSIGLVGSALLAVSNPKPQLIEKPPLGPAVEIPDTNSDFGKSLVEAAREQIGIVTEYDTSYFANAEVPENSGVCADVIWRALKKVGYDLRSEVDKDIRNNPENYPNVNEPDSAIDFRRVKNLNVFFDKYAERLTLEVIPGNVENLSKWKAGDFVTFAPLPDSGLTHIAIISSERRSDGVPMLIHNYGQGTLETDYLTNWPTPITGHYRLK